MSRRAQVYWSDSLLRYDFGPSHPMTPVRLELMMRLADELGVLDRVDVIEPRVATLDELRLVHSGELVAAVQRAGAADTFGDSTYAGHGLGTPDVPTFKDMHDVSSRVVGATIDAGRAVWSGGTNHAFSPAGGLHHSMPDSVGGFCVYNDIAVSIASLLEQGAERIAYVDLDVHHGDGVQTVFWDDPRVLTISLHQHPHTLYPGTGWSDEIGGPDAEGFAVNVPLPPGTDDSGWLRALHSIVPPLLSSFRPQMLVTQHGCDTHLLDPLANLAISLDAERVAAEAMHRWAHEFAEDRWLVTGGGGYEVVDVVPRIWTLVMAELSGSPIEPTTRVPEPWRIYVAEHWGRVAPLRMTDGVEPAITRWRADDAATAQVGSVDRSVLDTRRAVFPLHGLDPELDPEADPEAD